MCPSEKPGERLIVGPKFLQHVGWRDANRILVGEALMSRNITNGPEGCSADLSRTLCDRIGHLEDLCGLLIKKRVVITKMAAADVPVKALRFDVEREDIGEQLPKCG